MLLRGYGMDRKQRALLLEKRRWPLLLELVFLTVTTLLRLERIAMITIQDGNYHYTDEIGIHDIQLQIKRNDHFDGTKLGAGKSTLFKILVGLLPLSSGRTTLYTRIGRLMVLS